MNLSQPLQEPQDHHGVRSFTVHPWVTSFLRFYVEEPLVEAPQTRCGTCGFTPKAKEPVGSAEPIIQLLVVARGVLGRVRWEVGWAAVTGR